MISLNELYNAGVELNRRVIELENKLKKRRILIWQSSIWMTEMMTELY